MKTVDFYFDFMSPFAYLAANRLLELSRRLRRRAKRYGMSFNFPKSLDTARLNRGCLVAKSRGRGDVFLERAFDAVWGQGGDPAESALLRRVAEACEIQPESIERDIDSPETTGEYEKENLEAQGRGVFGVPIFLVDDQIYWGNDRIEFLEEYLRGEA